MAGILDFMQPKSLGGVADPYSGMSPEVARDMLAKLMASQGRTVDLSKMPHEQMIYMLRTLRPAGVDTIGVRG